MVANYTKIQDTILQNIISNRKPAILSKKLGFKFNKVSRWLNHQKKLKWEEFVDLCYVTKVPIEGVLENSFGITVRSKNECKNAFVKILLSQHNKRKTVSKALNRSRPTIYRITKHKSQPDFASVLALMDMKPGLLEKFTTEIMKKENLSQVTSPFSIPWFGVVSSAMAQKEHLALPSFSATWIAKKVKLTVPQVELAISVMLKNELIKWDGRHYQPTLPRTLALNHNRNKSDFNKTFCFWSQKSLTSNQFHEKGEPSDETSKYFFRTFMTTPDNVEKINQWVSELEERIHNLLTSTEGDKTAIRCLLISHFNVSETELL